LNTIISYKTQEPTNTLSPHNTTTYVILMNFQWKTLFNIKNKIFIIGQKNSTEINSVCTLHSSNLSNGTKNHVKNRSIQEISTWQTKQNKTNKQPSFIDKDKHAPCALWWWVKLIGGLHNQTQLHPIELHSISPTYIRPIW